MANKHRLEGPQEHPANNLFAQLDASLEVAMHRGRLARWEAACWITKGLSNPPGQAGPVLVPSIRSGGPRQGLCGTIREGTSSERSGCTAHATMSFGGKDMHRGAAAVEWGASHMEVSTMK